MNHTRRRSLLAGCRGVGCAALVLLCAGSGWAAPVAPDPRVIAAEQARIEVMRRAAPSVVAIFDPGGTSGGSGVLIDPLGHVVTNFHVVQSLGAFMKCGLNDGRLYDAVLLGIDPTGDVALIRLLGREDFPHAELGDSDAVRVGDRVFAMGNPFLLATDFQPTVTLGMVSGVQRYQYPAGTFLEYTDCLQVDASINPGNSGGPLFNARGEVIGINGRISIQQRGRVNVGAGYAISIRQVEHFLDHLKGGLIVDHATLGATVTATSDGAVVVSNILESSSAFRRGLRRGDEVVSFAGRPLRSVNQFKNILGIYPQGWKLPLEFLRDGERRTIIVELMPLHRRSELLGEETSRGLPDEESPQPKGERPQHDMPGGTRRPAVQAPPEYAHLFAARPGFANYAANTRLQEQLLGGVSALGDFTETPAGWSLAGEWQGQPLEIRLTPDAVVARHGERFVLQRLNEEFTDLPVGTGGLLAALEQFKHLLRDPHDYFTELYYAGSEPHGGERLQILTTTRGLATARWRFGGEEPALRSFEVSLGSDLDSVEIELLAPVQQGAVSFPRGLKVRHGDQDLGEWTIQSVKFFTPEAGAGATR